MTTFNNLVDDLMKENLLDDGNYSASKRFRKKTAPELPTSIELLQASTPDILELAEKHDLKLPDFSFFQPDNILEISPEDRTRSVLPDSPPQATFRSTQNFIRYQQTRPRPKKKKKGTKFCNHCELYMPFYSINCRFCNGRLTGSLSYYLMMMFAGVIVALLLFVILANKTYK